MAFQRGEVLDGRYTLLEEVGHGGMATVYKAAQPAVNRLVAIKVLPGHLAGDPTFYERFENEARVIAALEHPHILPVYDFGRYQGQAYLVMRYIEGGTLFDELRRGPMLPERMLVLLTQIADALDHAHRRGIVHRDIKPSNILLDRNGNAYVSDFGIAKALQQTTGLTGSGILGTPEYMAPEQAQGQPVDARTDLYALGIILFQMATGRLPFSSERRDPISLAYKHIAELPPTPRSINPTLLPEMDGVILKALAKDPSLRYSSTVALARAARAVIEADMMAGAVRRAAAGMRPQTAAQRPASAVNKLSSAALACGLAGAAMFLTGLLIALAGAFTRPITGGGALITIEDIGTPLVAAFVAGLAAGTLRLTRVLVGLSGCLGTATQAVLGFIAGTVAAFLGYLLYLFVTPTETTGGGLFGLLGSLLAVYSLFGFSVMGVGVGAGLAGPLRRGRPFWRNGLAVALPLILGAAGTAFAAYEVYVSSNGLLEFVRLMAFFVAEPLFAVAGLAAAELNWKFE